LRDQGVIYPGRLNHELNAATAVANGRVDPGYNLKLATDQWFDMVQEIRSSDGRTGVLSSEFYSETPADRIGWLMEQLGPNATVVITLRPLGKILTSQWQQYMQNRMVISWEDWLQAILAEPEPGKVTPSFWLRHRHDLLVRRWLDVVGPERLTVIAVNDTDPAFVLRSFEQLLGVAAGTLTPQDLRANRSLSVEEVELVRQFNQLCRSVDIGAVDYTPLIRYGALRYLQNQPIAAGSHRIRMPEWAIERAAELSRMMINDIVASGVKIIGPIAELSDPTRMPTPGDNPPVTDVTVELAADLAAGVIDSVDRYRTTRRPDPAKAPLLAAITRRYQTAEAARTKEELERTRRRIDATHQQINSQRLAWEAGRKDLMAELYRRARRRARAVIRS
jgi:hypothetical protein